MECDTGVLNRLVSVIFTIRPSSLPPQIAFGLNTSRRTGCWIAVPSACRTPLET